MNRKNRPRNVEDEGDDGRIEGKEARRMATGRVEHRWVFLRTGEESEKCERMMSEQCGVRDSSGRTDSRVRQRVRLGLKSGRTTLRNKAAPHVARIRCRFEHGMWWRWRWGWFSSATVSDTARCNSPRESRLTKA